MNTIIFDRLSGLRNRIAYWQRIYPQDVFNDAELRKICALMPQRIKDLTLVPDVRRDKLEKYGLRFLAEIRTFEEG